MVSVIIGVHPSGLSSLGSSLINTKRRRYLPCVLQERSGKQKKHPSLPSSSVPTKGEETSVPIKRRVCRLSCPVNAVSSVRPSTLHRVQWTTLKGYRNSAESGRPVESVTRSCTIGGGSITLRSLSPNPHALAATGCCRTVIRYLPELRKHQQSSNSHGC